jgi:hypothetical protein
MGVDHQHGLGHGTLVSHSTDVGCISKRRKIDVKKMLLVCAIGIAEIAIATATSASAQQMYGPTVSRPNHDGARAMGDKGRFHGYLSRKPHSCTWSATAACAAWRNGSYDRDGIRHQLVKRFPNGRYTLRVYQGNTRVK